MNIIVIFVIMSNVSVLTFYPLFKVCVECHMIAKYSFSLIYFGFVKYEPGVFIRSVAE